MAYRKNTRSTSIYWLFDTRTNLPFYCGKTVSDPMHRLRSHDYDARTGTTRVNCKVRECGEHIRIQVVETVPCDDDWGVREKCWIALLRYMYPDECCNTNAGGAGCPGRIISEETRAKMLKVWTGRKHTPEARAKITKFLTGRKRSPETIAKQRAKVTGRKRSPEQCATISAAQKAKFAGPQGDALRLAIGLRTKGVIVSAETREKQRVARLGKKHTDAARAKISAAGTGRKSSAEAIAKSAASRTGKKRTPEQRARMSAAHKGKPWSQAQRDAIPAGLIASWKRRKNDSQAAL